MALKVPAGNRDEDVVARMDRAFAIWDHLRKQIAEVEARIGKLVGELESRGDVKGPDGETKLEPGKRKRLRKEEISCVIVSEARRVYGARGGYPESRPTCWRR